MAKYQGNLLTAIPNETMPLFLLSLFGKSEKANMTKSERNELAKFTELLVKNYGVSNV